MPAAPHADAPAALAPPSAVSVKVGGCKYSTITLDGARVLQMTEMDFLDAILGMRVFSDRFVGVHPVRCTVSVVPLPPGMKTPDEAAEAKGVPLDADQTLGAAAVESGWTGGSKLFIQVRLPDPGVADASRFPARPPPIELAQARFNDETGAPMHVFTVENGHPFFLPDLARQQVVAWAGGTPVTSIGEQKLIVLTGPVKCGKTALLQALPRFLRGPRHPVVLSVTFSDHMPPPEAAASLVAAAAMLARDLGITLPFSPPSQLCFLTQLPFIVAKLAAGIAAAGGELILLLDEAQAPLLAAETPAQAASFLASLKALHRECHLTTRIAIAGSGMFALLNAIRAMDPHGYALWDAMSRVQLGATPAPAAAFAMATAIIEARSTWWPEEVKALVTPEYVLRCLEPVFPSTLRGADSVAGASTAAASPHRLTATRPALVGCFADLMGSADVGSPEAIAEAAAVAVNEKMLYETSKDAVAGLAALDKDQRQLVYCLAAGCLSRKAMKSSAVLGQSGRQLLDMLCEPVSGHDDDKPLQLLPPYGALFSEILSQDGDVLTERAHTPPAFG